ncbi:MAG TPA: glycosyltransferase [Thermoplasmata archaeon]|nr:glycosyltransferase [Thermoplasmata archaeon]
MGSSPATPSLVSVVITVRNEAAHIGQLLESLLIQQGPVEVVLVDAVSRDGTREIAEAFAARHPGFLRVFERNGSRGIGRNIGVHEARGEWVAFIDGDCFADSQWLVRLRAGLAQSPVVAGRTVVVGKHRYGQLERVELLQQGFDVTFPSCNLAFRRDLFLRLGGFDPRFITAEDIDLNMRAVQSGATIVYRPDALVYHHMRGTFLRFLIQAFWNGYGRKQLTEKHGSLWGRYRVRRLITDQRGMIAWTRLSAALAGYVTRVATGRDRRLTPELVLPTPHDAPQ